MEIYADTVSIIVENFWRDHIGADDDKYNEMQEYYDRVVREKLKPSSPEGEGFRVKHPSIKKRSLPSKVIRQSIFSRKSSLGYGV